MHVLQGGTHVRGTAIDNQGGERRNPALELIVGVIECLTLLLRRCCRGIRNAPVDDDRSAVPDWAGFARGAVAHGNHDVEFRRGRATEDVPGLGCKSIRRVPFLSERFERPGVHAARRRAAGATGAKPAAAQRVQQNFRDDAARRITGAKKQDVDHGLRGHSANCDGSGDIELSQISIG